MASDEVIGPDAHTDILREFFDFGDDLILPDKPFQLKKEALDYDLNFCSNDDSNDFFLGSTPSPSSSSTTSSSAPSSTKSLASERNNDNLDFAMSIANDFMNIDFDEAADVDVDIGLVDSDLDILGYDPVIDPVEENPIKIEKNRIKNKVLSNKILPDKVKYSAISRRDNVQVLTDLNSPLTSLRTKLEKRFNINLASFSIWLQDTTKLNDASTLSEQCVEGTGVVKVELNIQPHNKDGFKKINIMDVLKVGAETFVEKNYDDSSDGDVSYDEGITDSDTPVSNFVESVDFCELRKRFSYPNKISQWTRLHTAHWAKWVNRTFKGVKLNEEDWTIEGQDFSAMSEEEFSITVGNDPNSHLWSHFSLLRQTGMATVPSTYALKTLSNESVTKSVATTVAKSATKRTFEAVTPLKDNPENLQLNYGIVVHGSKIARRQILTPNSQPKKPRVILGKYEEGKVFINNDDSSNVHRSGNNGNNIQLWKFLLDILTDFKHRNIIRWSLGETCLDGEFVMSEPEGVAKLWGQQKGKATMNYEKLSRALRYYKGGNILDKVHNKKFTYRFVCDLRDLVGFSAKELDFRVRAHDQRNGK